MEDIFQILIFVVFAVLSFLPQVLKEKNKPVSSPHPAPMEEDVEDWLSEEWKEEETAISSIEQEVDKKNEPVSPISAIVEKESLQSDEQKQSSSRTFKKVRLNSPAEARRAFIYSEIFNRKYQ